MFLQLIASFLLIGTCFTEEPRCTQFDFEKNLLQMLVRMEFEINQTNQKLGVMEDKLARQVQRKEDIRDTAETLKEHQLRIQVLEETLAKEVPSVSFFVKGHQSALRENRPIFSEIYQNDGESYNVSTGVFTTRVAGVYHFAFTFLSNSDQDPHCSMYRNGLPLIFAYAKGEHDSATMVAYLKLSIGDTFAIRCYEWEKIFHGGTRSMWFTGSLVRT